MASLECAPTPRTRCAAALGVALWCAACSDAPPPDAIVRVDTLDGITHTVASDVPEQGGQGLELLWRAPDEASIRTGAEWANPTRIAANERLIAVLDPQLARVHLFTPEGVRSGSFGRRGGGPGELTNPASLGVHGDSVLVISSLARPALQWFGPDGSYRGSAEGADGEATGGAHFLPESGIVRQTVDLDADGRYLVRHPFDRPIRSLAASDTRLVVLVEDDRTGLRKLEAYRLP